MPRILKFSEGIIEIGLRVAVIAFGIAALVAAAITLARTVGDEQLTAQVDGIQRDINDGLLVPESERAIVENYNGTVAAGGVVTGIAGFAIISETAITVLRLVYVCRKQTKFLFMLDILLSTFLTVGHLAGGITATLFAAEWDDFTSGTIDNILTSLAVAAAFSFASAIMCAILALWMLFFMVYKWNEKQQAYDVK